MARMKPPVVPDKPIPVVPEDALRRLLAACAGKGFEARRDTALITFLLDTRARRGEVAGLRWATAKPERAERSRNGQRAAERGQFNDEPSF
jgi:integrase